MSEVPVIHKVVDIRVAQVTGGAVIYAVLEDGSVIGGGMHGIEVRVRPGNMGMAEFDISGPVNP